ncbi:MAG: hypothetical protein QM682_17535 [Paracoccus sp. (in: a-proteobacteria)]|uniref:hypothetical protein n=1 Tax=Paracoccus sp. TaxID=267 RepID=UPI0039E2F4E1
MTQALLAILDSRSFGSIWFWLLLVLAWTMAGRRVLGVPVDVVQAARQPQGPGDDPAALALLDWLSLSLPRWRIGRIEAALFLGLAAFALTALFILGFLYGLEMAQALVLLILPFAVLFGIELRLAHGLEGVVADAQDGRLAANEAAALASRRLRRHRAGISVGSILVMALTAYRGAIWLATHPYGF